MSRRWVLPVRGDKWHDAAVNARLAATVTVAVLFVALVAILWLTTPWQPTVTAKQTATAADNQFTPAERAKGRQFHREIRPWSYAALAVGLVVSVAFGFTPLGARLIDFVARPFGEGWAWRAVIGGLLLGLIAQLCALPFAARVEIISRRYGLSVRQWGNWWLDIGKGLLISAVLATLLLLGYYALVRASPNWWWVWVGAAAAVLIFVASLVYPLLIEPIFNKFTPMEDSALRRDLIALAAADGVPVKDVLVADASRRTNALNAYVSGLGPTRRIVVYDTLLNQAPDEEIKLVVAHELGHAKRNDVLFGTAIAALGAIVAVSAAYLLFSWRSLLRMAGVSELADPRSIGLVLAVIALASFLTLPIQNLVSRRIETRADQHALELTNDPDTFSNMQHRLATKNLSDIQPPLLVYIWFSSHPTAPQRLALARQYAREHEQDSGQSR